MIKYKKYATSVALLFAASIPTSAFAYSQCQVKVSKLWEGDGGYFWIHYTNGGSVKIGPDDLNRETATAMAMTALVGERDLIVRYSTDDVDCTSTARTDFVGLYLL